jgi:hypothetical protein
MKAQGRHSGGQARRGAIAAALLLAGCAPDYSAVRDWSALAAATADYPPLPQSVTAAPARLARFATPALPEADRAARAEALAGLQEATTAWLGLLALMAEDGLPPARENPLTAAAARIAPVDPVAAAGATNLGAVMADAARRNWRAPQLAYVLAPADAPLRAVLAGLRTQVDALAPDEAAERAALAAHFGALAAAARDPALRAALEEAAAQRSAALDTRAAGRTAYLAAITAIEAGHAALVARQRVLSQAETARMLRGQEATLRRAAGLLPPR